MADALLVLADGTSFAGRAFGAEGETFGEAVFNTSLTGYQEVLTDPSYHGQIVAMTYPHQGNYGLNAMDAEAPRPWVSGFVVREYTGRPSSWRSEEDLDAYLRRHGVVGIAGIDTRKLVRRLRVEGAMQAGISTVELDRQRLLAKVHAAPGLLGRDLVREVTPAEPYDADPEELRRSGLLDPSLDWTPDPRIEGAKVAAIDCGMKRNILRCLTAIGFRVRVFPASSSAESILAWGPDAVFVSNGPGDPSAVGYTIATIRDILVRRVPTFGICLGHQLTAQALGAHTYKLKFGHRGSNHPVKNFITGRVEITSHNHGFAVGAGEGPAETSGDEAWRVLSRSTTGDRLWRSQLGDVALTHFDLNDGTLEGLRCMELPAYTVQYHPEAAPGPHDSRYLFRDLVELVVTGRPDTTGSRTPTSRGGDR